MKRWIWFWLLLPLFCGAAETDGDVREWGNVKAWTKACDQSKKKAAEQVAVVAHTEYRKKKNLEKGEAYYEQAIRLCPKADYFYELGNISIDLKKYEDAITAYTFAKRLGYGKPFLLYYNAACAASLNKKVDRSLKYLEKALETGYKSYDHIVNDAEMANTRKDVRFYRLMRKYDSNFYACREIFYGEWWPMPSGMPAGCPENYVFEENEFCFYEDENIPAHRLIYFKGKWGYKKRALLLTKKEERCIEGGRIEEGPMGDEIINGTVLTRKIDKSPVIVLNIRNLKWDTDLEMFKADFNGKTYWRWNKKYHNNTNVDVDEDIDADEY